MERTHIYKRAKIWWCSC